MKSEPKDYGYGVINYWQPSGQIRKMEELDATEENNTDECEGD
jgi:hypothetical protein